MMSVLLATFAGLIVPSQTVSSDDQIWVIRRTDGPTVYGYIRRDKDGMLEVELDSESSKRGKLYIPSGKVVSREPEPKSRRTARLQEQAEQDQKNLKAQGLTPVPGGAVSTDESVYANRARDMALAHQAAHAGKATTPMREPSDGASVTATPTPAERPSFLRQWGRHILIGAVGLALSALVIKTLLM